MPSKYKSSFRNLDNKGYVYPFVEIMHFRKAVSYEAIDLQFAPWFALVRRLLIIHCRHCIYTNVDNQETTQKLLMPFTIDMQNKKNKKEYLRCYVLV